MARPPSPEPEPAPRAVADDASPIAVISAYGAFRVLVVLLAIWTFFAGFALITGFGPLTFGGDRTAERVAGLQMIIGFVPVYALLAWDRQRYRLLIWVPYGAQAAIIIPAAWSLFSGDPDGVLLMIVSLIFFVLMFYFWWHSHPLDFFRDDPDDEDWEDEEDGDDADANDGAEDAHAPASRGGAADRRGFSRDRGQRERDVSRRPGRFRRRDP